MRKITKILMLSIGVMLFAAARSNAQVYVRSIPVHKPTVRPRQPKPQNVWFPDDWEVMKNKYVFVPGYWTIAPQPGLKWTPGKWEHNAKGYIWIRGHWAY